MRKSKKLKINKEITLIRNAESVVLEFAGKTFFIPEYLEKIARRSSLALAKEMIKYDLELMYDRPNALFTYYASPIPEAYKDKLPYEKKGLYWEHIAKAFLPDAIRTLTEQDDTDEDIMANLEGGGSILRKNFAGQLIQFIVVEDIMVDDVYHIFTRVIEQQA